jgi:hypothetical protein
MELLNMEVQDESVPVQDGLADQVMDSVGVGEQPDGGSSAPEEEGSEGSHSKESLAVQKRLKAQRRAHEREVRELHARIGDLESRMGQPMQQAQDQSINPYPPDNSVGVDETIQKAVSYALRQKELEERKARDAQEAAHVQKSYQGLNKHLESMNDKYDDFHDTVFGQDIPYTAAMRDYALTLPRSGAGSAGEVLYKLGKNRPELERISKLHPIDQSSELAKLSHSLISGGEAKPAQHNRPLGQIKNNPVSNSHAVTEKTPIGSIRERMRSGTWK